jgi:hypothetical protein
MDTTVLGAISLGGSFSMLAKALPTLVDLVYRDNTKHILQYSNSIQPPHSDSATANSLPNNYLNNGFSLNTPPLTFDNIYAVSPITVLGSRPIQVNTISRIDCKSESSLLTFAVDDVNTISDTLVDLVLDDLDDIDSSDDDDFSDELLDTYLDRVHSEYSVYSNVSHAPDNTIIYTPTTTNRVDVNKDSVGLLNELVYSSSLSALPNEIPVEHSDDNDKETINVNDADPEFDLPDEVDEQTNVATMQRFENYSTEDSLPLDVYLSINQNTAEEIEANTIEDLAEINYEKFADYGGTFREVAKR